MKLASSKLLSFISLSKHHNHKSVSSWVKGWGIPRYSKRNSRENG